MTVKQLFNMKCTVTELLSEVSEMTVDGETCDHSSMCGQIVDGKRYDITYAGHGDETMSKGDTCGQENRDVDWETSGWGVSAQKG